MARLSDFEPIEFRGLQIPTHARCVSFLRTLETDDSFEKPTSKSPVEIVNAVLDRGGKGLTLSERRQLPILMLQAKFQDFQPAFALEVIKNHSKSSRFWRMLFRGWLVTYNPEGPLGELVSEALSKNIQKLPSHLQAMVEKFPILDKKPDFGNVTQALIGNQISADELRALGLNEQGEVTTRFAARMLSEGALFLKSGSASSAQLKNFRDLVAPQDTIHDSVQMAAMVGLIMGSANRPAGEEIVEDISKLIGSAFDDPMVRRDR